MLEALLAVVFIGRVWAVAVASAPLGLSLAAEGSPNTDPAVARLLLSSARYDLPDNKIANTDPRSGAVRGTGLLLETRRYATPPATLDCGNAAPADAIVTRSTYCSVAGGSCPSGSVQGELPAITDPNGNLTSYLGYDVQGALLKQQKVISATSTVSTTWQVDARGRVFDEADSMGRHTVRQYDGLDRISQLDRLNTKGNAVHETDTYYPDGRLRTQTNGLGLTHAITLNGLNRPAALSNFGAEAC